VAHSVELLLDPEAESDVRQLWQLLDDADLPSQVQVNSPTNRPHITLLAAARISPDLDEVLRPVTDRLPLPVAVGATLLLGGRAHRSAPATHTLARLVIPSADLLDLHAEVYRRSLPYLTDPFEHCRPGHWTPHLTLGRRLRAEQIGVAVSVLAAGGRGTAAGLAAEAAGLRRWDSDLRVDHLLVGR
jgi:2'-5' RNA ligase